MFFGGSSPSLRGQLSPLRRCLSIGLGGKPRNDGLPVENNEHAKHLQGNEGYDPSIYGRDVDPFRCDPFKIKIANPTGGVRKLVCANGKKNGEPDRVKAEISDHWSH